MPKDRSSGLPSARELSNGVTIKSKRQSQELTYLFMSFGQFLDHDIDHTPVAKDSNGRGIDCCDGQVRHSVQIAGFEDELKASNIEGLTISPHETCPPLIGLAQNCPDSRQSSHDQRNPGCIGYELYFGMQGQTSTKPPTLQIFRTKNLGQSNHRLLVIAKKLFSPNP